MVHFNNYINGNWEKSESNEKYESINPVDQSVVGSVDQSTINDLDKAVESAKSASLAWKKLSGAARGQYLYKAADVLEENLEDVAKLMTLEMGKTYPEAKGETARGVAILRYYAGEGMREEGDVIPSTDPDAFMYTKRSPLGVVGVITPWNFPVAIPIWKMAPALIYGNTVVFKPALEASVTAAKVFECLHEAEFPKGVLNMVNGDGAVIGERITENPDINGITFTGSDKVGKVVGQTALGRGAKYQLEMGGKNPVIVTKDADIDKAVEATISGGLRSTGQKCTATSRVIIDASIYDSFKEKLVEKVKDIKVGDGMQEDTWMGPCVSEKQLNTVLSYIDIGKKEGATLIHGGERITSSGLENGFFVQPTIFEDVNSAMTIAQEEIFGPVLALIKVKDLEEGIKIANDVEFGLSASIFTTNIQNMLTFIDDMEAGLVRVNAESAGVELQAPFGGMKKSSSHSREQGQAAKEFFTSIKTVFVKG
ncbi:alpha-ketoglutaric semialdehyde dehydrogenase GucD [Saliterribacillus persicus]|uniref:Aldehyde dehydrogenase (NAD+) n=1 Tax=Saliterribacillus persicus TaxID=930114 RepID=A0A368Y9V3_9BACI|nr:alpha-ketoglutaric semialdehyde dehydrogenase GucD [Saliterribacillus persicus]RCW76895.1 aldehyde dehydrogenase (NAD+) [Saliterribacillus persicus]